VCGRTYVGAVGCLISWLLSRPCLVGSPRVDSPSISMYIVHCTHSICTHIVIARLGLVVSRCALCGRVVRAGLIFAWGDGDDATGDRPARKTAIGYRVAASSEPLSPRKPLLDI